METTPDTHGGHDERVGTGHRGLTLLAGARLVLHVVRDGSGFRMGRSVFDGQLRTHHLAGTSRAGSLDNSRSGPLPAGGRSMTSNERGGLALVLGAAALVGVMVVHPTGPDAAGAGHGLSTAVHTVAILAELTLLLGALRLTVHLAAMHDTAIAAFITYAASTMSLIIAAVAAGWMDPSVAATINGPFATVGFGLAAIAIVLWSVAIWRTGFSRTLGTFGAAIGATTLGGMMHGATLALHGFGGIVLLALTVWMASTGLMLRAQREGPA